jgi:predicted TIM-barrel fold metal-dependent hydrolase
MPDATQPFPVIDAHTHLFPPDVHLRRAHYCSRDRWFGELYADPKAAIADAAALVASMDGAGIAHSIVCGWPWRDLGLCREHNDFMAEAATAGGGRISWLAIVPPDVKGAAAEIERCFTLGAAGIGELNADAQEFSWEETARLTEAMRVCIDAARPALIHTSEPVGHRYPGKGEATPARLIPFLAAFPDLKVVAAHWGGGLPFYELMPEVAEVTKNVVYDSAASTYLYRFDIFPAVAGIVGADRVLFASDYPLLSQDRFRQRVLRAGIAAANLPAIMGGNAARVFNLSLDSCGERS